MECRLGYEIILDNIAYSKQIEWYVLQCDRERGQWVKSIWNHLGGDSPQMEGAEEQGGQVPRLSVCGCCIPRLIFSPLSRKKKKIKTKLSSISYLHIIDNTGIMIEIYVVHVLNWNSISWSKLWMYRYLFLIINYHLESFPSKKYTQVSRTKISHVL